MTDTKQQTPPAETSFRFIGKPVVRKEDERLTTGHGRFSDDFSVAGQARAVMVRSPHPHARILGVSVERAKAMPGVLGVFTGADCLADGLGPIPHDPVPKTKYDMKLAGPRGGTIFIGLTCCCRPTRRATWARRWPWWSPGRWRRRSTPPRRSRSSMTCCPVSIIPRTRYGRARPWSGTR